MSSSSKDDICRDFGVYRDNVQIVPLGVDTRLFRPRPDRPRVKGRIVTVTSADSPLKGLSTLLRAVAKLATEREAHLMVNEKIDAMFEAGASLMGGATAATVIGRYCEHVAANAKRLAIA